MTPRVGWLTTRHVFVDALDHRQVRFVFAKEPNVQRGNMSGFYVDPAGMNGLYNVLHRASNDVDDTLGYVKRHCDLSFGAEGLLGIFASPHLLV